jgi:hypothetical protein
VPKVTLTVFGGDRTIVITLIVPGARTVWKAARLLVEGKFNMEKIIILTGDSQGNGRLIACLGMLFPECEIQILSRRTESFGHVPVAPEPISTNKGGKKNGEHSHCR